MVCLRAKENQEYAATPFGNPISRAYTFRATGATCPEALASPAASLVHANLAFGSGASTSN
jgi:hypothetical protein